MVMAAVIHMNNYIFLEILVSSTHIHNIFFVILSVLGWNPANRCFFLF